jgi:hypothetical protein
VVCCAELKVSFAEYFVIAFGELMVLMEFILSLPKGSK